MKTSELKQMKQEDLKQFCSDLKEELFKLRCQSVTDQLENPARIRQVRKDVARGLTVLRQMQEVENAAKG